MMIVGVHHFAVNVRDFDRMLQFTGRHSASCLAARTSTSGNEPVIDHMIDVKGSAARSVMLRGGNCYIELFEYASPPPVSAVPLRPYDKGYTHLCVETDDMAEDYRHLQACGVDFTGRHWLMMNDVKAVYGSDPEGNVIEIQQCSADSPQRLGLLSVPSQG